MSIYNFSKSYNLLLLLTIGLSLGCNASFEAPVDFNQNSSDLVELSDKIEFSGLPSQTVTIVAGEKFVVSTNVVTTQDILIEGYFWQKEVSNVFIDLVEGDSLKILSATSNDAGSYRAKAVAWNSHNTKFKIYYSQSFNIMVQKNPVFKPCPDGMILDSDNDCVLDTSSGPKIASVSGSLINGNQITITGSGFSAKLHPKPLFWWKADFGIKPSALGRLTSWKETGLGNFSTKIVAPGSQKSVGYDHAASSGAALSTVVFDSDRMYLHRKTYEDFDITKDYFVNAEGTFKSFNFKSIRLWSPAGGGSNNIHLNAQGANNDHAFKVTPEYTGKTFYGGGFINKLYQLPNEWKVEELEYKSSGIGVKNGLFRFYQNRLLGPAAFFKMRTTNNPDRYNRVVQSQVSKRAQPGSIMYYDSLYIDESWHRVVICATDSWSHCRYPEIQIPKNWSDGEITITINLESLDQNKSHFLYIVDQAGVANSAGFRL